MIMIFVSFVPKHILSSGVPSEFLKSSGRENSKEYTKDMFWWKNNK